MKLAIVPHDASHMWQSQRGNTAITFALMATVLAGMGGAALDQANILNQRARLQAVVDAVALASAHELSIPAIPARAIEQTATTAASDQFNLNSLAPRAAFDASVHERRNAIDVHGTLTIPSLMPNQTPRAVTASATAENLQRTPLCLLMVYEHWGAKIQLKNDASLHAPGCLVQVNGDIDVASTSTLVGEKIHAEKTARGATIPKAVTDVLPIPDPFATTLARPTVTEDDCRHDTVAWRHVSGTLLPGKHCATLIVPAGESLRLEPGDHLFRHELRLEDGARLDGVDVALVFTNDGVNNPLKAADTSVISLEGRRDGPFAGMVLSFATIVRKGLKLNATGVRNLTGVVYMPKGIIELEANGDVAEASDWTVIVSEQLILSGKARLVINKNYAGSDVPVPSGVGPDNKIILRR